MERSRLNAARGIGDHTGDPKMASSLTRMFANSEPAVANLERMLATIGAFRVVSERSTDGSSGWPRCMNKQAWKLLLWMKRCNGRGYRRRNAHTPEKFFSC